MRLIDADALHDYMRARKKWVVKSDGKHNEGYTYDQVHFGIDAQPTVDAVPVRHGKWEMKPDPYGFFDEIPVCSECGCTTKMREKTKYCPHCGARMDGE